MQRLRWPIFFGVTVFLFATIGCGSKPVKLTGKIVQSKPETPLKVFPPTQGKFEILFTPIGQTGNSDRATRADPSGAFMIDNLPVGKYKVAVTLQETPQSADKLNGKFAKGKTPIEVEVKDSTPIEIDISQ